MSATPEKDIYLTFVGQIDGQAVQKFFNTFAAAVNQGTTRAHLLLQSGGGFVGDGVALYNFLRNLPLELNTYNAGAVQSIATLVFLAGKIRKCSKAARFMVHKTTYTFVKPPTAVEMRQIATTAELDDRSTEEILRSHLNLPDEKWTLHERTDLFIGSDEARDWSLVHEISDFAPPKGASLFNV